MAEIAYYLKEQEGLEKEPRRTTSMVHVCQAFKLLV
jgi:hypothetical protein